MVEPVILFYVYVYAMNNPFYPNGSSPSTLTGKVNQLEVILRQLQQDLRKVSLLIFIMCLHHLLVSMLAHSACLCHTDQNDTH